MNKSITKELFYSLGRSYGENFDKTYSVLLKEADANMICNFLIIDYRRDKAYAKDLMNFSNLLTDLKEKGHDIIKKIITIKNNRKNPGFYFIQNVFELEITNFNLFCELVEVLLNSPYKENRVKTIEELKCLSEKINIKLTKVN